MLYVIHGTDQKTARDKAGALVRSLREKRPDAAFVRIDGDTWHASAVHEHLGGQGLFSNKYIVFLDRVTENVDAKETLADFAAEMKESANIFIVLEGKLLVDLKRALEKHAEKMVECAEKEAVGRAAKEPVNVFALGDAVGARDAFKAWMLYREAIDGGIEPENVAGTLFWQVKSIMLAAGARSAGDAGLSPFVFTKSKKLAGNYAPEELSRFSGELVALYHEAHRGRADFELSLERLLLAL